MDDNASSTLMISTEGNQRIVNFCQQFYFSCILQPSQEYTRPSALKLLNSFIFSGQNWVKEMHLWCWMNHLIRLLFCKNSFCCDLKSLISFHSYCSDWTSFIPLVVYPLFAMNWLRSNGINYVDLLALFTLFTENRHVLGASTLSVKTEPV